MEKHQSGNGYPGVKGISTRVESLDHFLRIHSILTKHFKKQNSIPGLIQCSVCFRRFHTRGTVPDH